MTWRTPIPYRLVPTRLADRAVGEGEAPLPLSPHPGAFGVRRRYEVHTGVDLYAPEGTPVSAVEDGVVVGVEWFTGPDADPPCPWWLPTKAVLVEGASGVVLYGEVEPDVAPGWYLRAGATVGRVARVLRHDKGLPTSMLHLELHVHGTIASSHPWELEGNPPRSLLDPTPLLQEAE